MNETKYVIKHNGYFIQEAPRYGEFYRVMNIDQANEFHDLDIMKRYIQDELKLNLANVSIVEIKTITTTTNLILLNGMYVNRDLTEYCTECDTLHLISNMRWYRANNVDKPELYCEKCYDEVDSNYPNVSGVQPFDEESV